MGLTIVIPATALLWTLKQYYRSGNVYASALVNFTTQAPHIVFAWILARRLTVCATDIMGNKRNRGNEVLTAERIQPHRGAYNEQHVHTKTAAND